jgi:subtilisin family serine protease
MRHPTWILTIASAPFLSLAQAQEARRPAELPGETQSSLAPAPAESVQFPGSPRVRPTSKNELLRTGEGLRAELDDSVPLPNRAQITAGVDGDQRTAEADGDPYFLSFAGGSLYPPEGEHVDPALVRAASNALAAHRSSTFAFVMFNKRMTPARIAALESLGIETLSFHPHYCLRVAIPVASIDACAALDFVRWVGVSTPQQKVHPVLAEQLAQQPTLESVDVWIDVFSSDLSAGFRRELVGSAQLWDAGAAGAAVTSGAVRVQSGGWQEAALQQLGVEVIEYVDSIRAFRARIAPSLLENLIDADFVQFVEPNIAPSPAHDESRPMVSNDIVQGWYNGAVSQGVTIGHVDSGVDIGHQDLNSVWAVGWDMGGGGAFSDGCEHGSHVMGTILGRGSATPSLKGNAPGLASWGGGSRAFVARIFNDLCGTAGVSLANVASVMNTDFWDGAAVSPKPMAINNSWGTWWSGAPWVGSEANPPDTVLGEKMP